MDHLREAAAAAVESCPDLATDGAVLGDRDNRRHMAVARERQRRPDQPHRLRQPPADAAHRGLQHLAGVDRAFTVGEALAETLADREWQRGPALFRQQRAEARIADLEI